MLSAIMMGFSINSTHTHTLCMISRNGCLSGWFAKKSIAQISSVLYWVEIWSMWEKNTTERKILSLYTSGCL